VAVVTGANTGIGEQVAMALAAMGATTVLACRDPAKGAAAARRVAAYAASDAVAAVALDLADLDSVRRAAATIAATWGRVDVLVNNAGAISTRRRTTAQGFEQTFGVNHLGHFYLTRRLLDLLTASAPARIVNVSSVAHRLAVRGLRWHDLQRRHWYWGVTAYGHSKLANLLFTKGLAARLDPAAVTANAVHPGPVRTSFGLDGDARGVVGVVNHLIRPFELGAQEGADTVIFLAADPAVARCTGGYWWHRRLVTPSRAARDDRQVQRLWSVSERLLADAGYA
jgi:NAD(P)-dependent dehydrogenase (short-subunit alcohol dehydrogenase family)